MSSLYWCRIVLTSVVLCWCGCLSEEVPSPWQRAEEVAQGDDVGNMIVKDPVLGQHKKYSACLEDDSRFSASIPRDTWYEKKGTVRSIRPSVYVVVRDGGRGCETHAECLASLSEEVAAEGAEEAECRTRDNFYVGGDGEVYEGRGWHVAPYWHLNGMRRRAVTVKFLGSHETEGPSERALRAFWRLARSGVWETRLSPDYRVVSMAQVYDDTSLVGDALEKAFHDTSVGIKEFNRTTTWETTPDKSLPLISREEWGARKPRKHLEEIGYNAKYVMINEGGERCFTREDCTSRIKGEQEEQLPLYGDLVDNFYIGDDGFVYEGRGFNVKPMWDTRIPRENKYFTEETFMVRFLGNFQSDHPSENAIGAFKLLVAAGHSLGKLPDDYNIYSLRDIYNDSRFLGDGFHQMSRDWTPWASELDERIEKLTVDGEGFIGLVERSDWEAGASTKEFGNIKHPVDYIIISEYSESHRCTNSKDCISLMKNIKKRDQEGYGDVMDNFFVSENGNVYEGRGWDAEPHFQIRYFNRSLITVNFLGNHQKKGASLPALAVFENLIRVGIKLGKISPNYKLYSSGSIYDSESLLGEGLKKYFVDREEWSKNLDTLTENERLDSGLLPIIPLKEWSGVSLKSNLRPYTEPIRFVVIGKTGKRCFAQDECTETLKDTLKSSGRGPLDNFYIGDDGLAYEGRGWTHAPSIYFEGFKSEFYYVTFLSEYADESRPSPLSVLALDRLLENGVKTQKLSPHFKIISIHQLVEDHVASSDRLYTAMKTWDRWASDFDLLPPVDHAVFVSRADWHAEDPGLEIPELEHPLSHVLVHSVGDHCSDLETCTTALKAIQKNTPRRQRDVADNFYVGDDGRVYEGRGWDRSSLWATKGIERKFISVAFLGSFESTPPSLGALFALYNLQQSGIVQGKLRAGFKMASLGDIIKENIVASENLITFLNVTESWSDENDLKFDRTRLRSLNSPFVLTDEWNLSDLAIRRSSQMSKPLTYIAIRDGGESCDDYEACLARIRKEHQYEHDSNGGVAENFYIGNDGNVYEGVGWDWDMKWGFSGWQQTVTVQFFGKYENSLPSAKAIEAFNAVIIKDGIETGQLKQDYKIAPIPEGDDRTLGKKLREEVMTWKNAVEEIE